MFKRMTVILGLISVGAIAVVGCAQAPDAETPGQFYQGKTITIAVSGSAGSSCDIASRIIAPYLSEETGAKVKVENYGTEEGVNWVYNEAARDGLTILAENRGNLLLNDILHAPGANYDTEQFICIATVVPAPYRIFAVSPECPYTTLEALRQATGLKAGASSARGSGATSCVIIFEIMQLDGKVITGYDGRKAAALACARGEVDIIISSASSAVKDEKNGNQVNLFLMGVDGKRSPLAPDLPTASEFGIIVPAEWEDAYSSICANGRTLFLPPDVPQDRVEYLRQAVYHLFENEQFIAEITNFAGVWYGYIPGDEVQAALIGLKGNKELGAQIESLFLKYTATR